MRRRSILGMAALAILSMTQAARADQKTAPAANPPQGSSCGNYGTSVEFLSTPAEAARKAEKEEKLVFVLHVSGHFEDPRFT